MSFSIRYRPPDADNAFVLEGVDEVVIGRNPGDDGLTLTPTTTPSPPLLSMSARLRMVCALRTPAALQRLS